ncbi:MAG: CcmD family protein [Ignavibacteriae bacterium]|nr:MAG: CcmD family protein [Ignavibacteriota bacterium]
MMDFLTVNAGYVVLACALLIWAGIAAYLWRVERRVNELEQRLSR